MPTAYCLIRSQPHYRREAFDAGLARAGFTVRETRPVKARPGDLLVIWNRYSDYEVLADAFEKEGGKVLVAENGYLGADTEGRQFYALAVHGHNGSGRFPEGGPERFAALHLQPANWRESGEHVLVCGQRGIGSRTMASPPDWHNQAARRLRSATKRPVQVRGHPEAAPPPVGTLAENMAGAHAVVVWSSGSGIKALMAGYPVYYDAPRWILEGASRRLGEDIEAPKVDDAARLRALERMAWAQWSVAEIESGEPFVRLAAL